MAEALSALAGMTASAGGGRVALSEAPLRALAQVQAWPTTAQAVTDALSTLPLGEIPPIGKASERGGLLVAHVAPRRFMIAGPDADLPARLTDLIPASAGSVTNLTHGRAILSLEGDAAREVLQKCVALDLADAAFPVGRAAATMIHHVDVLIVRRGSKRFGLWVLRSFAEALAEWLLDAGLEEGIGFRPR
jgi:methylglutamate dehydrogenase subunit D